MIPNVIGSSAGCFCLAIAAQRSTPKGAQFADRGPLEGSKVKTSKPEPDALYVNVVTVTPVNSMNGKKRSAFLSLLKLRVGPIITQPQKAG